MEKKRLCVIAAACLAAVSCTTKGENEPQPSLEVSPTSAAAAPVQEVTVTAIGTDWEYERVGNASEVGLRDRRPHERAPDGRRTG